MGLQTLTISGHNVGVGYPITGLDIREDLVVIRCHDVAKNTDYLQGNGIAKPDIKFSGELDSGTPLTVSSDLLTIILPGDVRAALSSPLRFISQFGRHFVVITKTPSSQQRGHSNAHLLSQSGQLMWQAQSFFEDNGYSEYLFAKCSDEEIHLYNGATGFKIDPTSGRIVHRFTHH